MAQAGGWASPEALKLAYQRLDDDSMLREVTHDAGVVKSVNTGDLKSPARKGLRVRVPPPASSTRPARLQYAIRLARQFEKDGEAAQWGNGALPYRLQTILFGAEAELEALFRDGRSIDQHRAYRRN